MASCDYLNIPKNIYPCRYIEKDTNAYIIYPKKNQMLTLINLPIPVSATSSIYPFINYKLSLKYGIDDEMNDVEIVSYDIPENQYCSKNDFLLASSVKFIFAYQPLNGCYKIGIYYNNFNLGWLKVIDKKIYYTQSKYSYYSHGLTYDEAEYYKVTFQNYNRITIQNYYGENIYFYNLIDNENVSMENLSYEILNESNVIKNNCDINKIIE